MARITLDGLGHAYAPDPQTPEDWALKQLDFEFADGGAYALLGPSGCGKTTLLNIISGLLTPSRGRVLFDGEDVAGRGPAERNIAQVFQFPVIYDTMTVRQNLAFPLRNRGVPAAEIAAKVAEIADMTDLTEMLDRRASGLTADGKQKISLGRGLVRDDVNVIMFDEPLTVIDPHLKWLLRSKLKELHRRIDRTMIYVTHDQVEALTFADQVVLMKDGEVVQIGTPVDLFERPAHTFVGHFIGSPGMNLLPCAMDGGRAVVCGAPVEAENVTAVTANSGLELGVRPEFVRFADSGLPVRVTRVMEAGRYRVVETATREGQMVKLLVSNEEPLPSEEAHLAFEPARTRIYENGWLAGGRAAS
ncbi:MAG: ABC transporter ATP-binding protein [Rhizobiales bacterium NRL2]|jgi:glycerol transport system ATP-binding protein|nr:MAG: ABC transporter ATP-binding protein [Rhizobiales bacterium NRL2]